MLNTKPVLVRTNLPGFTGTAPEAVSNLKTSLAEEGEKA